MNIDFFKGLQLLCKNNTPTFAYNMNSRNVHNFPTITKCMFFPFGLMFFINVVLISFKHYYFIIYVAKKKKSLVINIYYEGGEMSKERKFKRSYKIFKRKKNLVRIFSF